MSIRALTVDEEQFADRRILSLVKTEKNFEIESERGESIMVRTAGRTVFIRLDEIEWIEAAANYVKIFAGEEQYVVREKISSIEQQLPAHRFVRVHRSLIAGIDHIRELQPCGNGEFVVVLRRAKELPLGRTYRAHVESTLKRVLSKAV